MITLNINGKNINVLQNFKEIKTHCLNSDLFSRWSNRTQFLNFMLQQESYADNYGTSIGTIVGNRYTEDWEISVYDVSSMSADEFDEAIEAVKWGDSFFLEDKNNPKKIYFVFTNVD